MMYRLEYSTQFKKDFKKITKLPISDIIEVGDIISKLQRAEELAEKHVDHSLAGNWLGFRDYIIPKQPEDAVSELSKEFQCKA